MLLSIGLASLIFSSVFLAVVVWPRYRDPITRLYTSKFGYRGVARTLGHPFPVTGQTIHRCVMTSRLQGEGMLASEPIQVPIVTMGRILRVHVEEGDRVKKGQLLVELDDRRAKVKVAAADAAITTAIGERERTKLGSSYILEQERPERDKLRLQTARELAAIQRSLARIDQELSARGSLSRRELLMGKAEVISAKARVREMEWSVKVASAGQRESVSIAESKLEEARLALEHRQLELEDYKVFAPCDGIVERCLVHEGEYNPDPGKPAFLLAHGLWFEARMDQSTVGRFALGDSALVYLEAFPNQPLRGDVTKISPKVSYDLGGPEATRPIRPLGSGAPEWPSTFAVRIELEANDLTLLPGMTGFVRIQPQREVLAAPREAVFAQSGRSALVYIVDGSTYRPQKVVLGTVSEAWAEIRSGLRGGEVVLTDGFHSLEPGDRVALTRSDHRPVEPPMVLEDGAWTPHALEDKPE